MPYTHLTPRDRYVISHLKVAKFSLREIARRLGRHHTTISRELKRNGPTYPGGVYWYYFIERQVEINRHRARSYRRQSHPPLVQYIDTKLREDWPPEVIAQRLRSEFPHDERMRISHETIYRWVFLDAEQGGNLHRHLRRRHKCRRRQKRYGAGRRFIPGRVGIETRPEVVAERGRYGDWEADLVLGRRGSGAIATHIERKSRYLMASLLPDRKAETFNASAIPAYQSLPQGICHTLTLDNGKEFSRFKDLEAGTGLKVFFADAYSAWQRGANENINGLLRFYFPKGMNFKRVSEKALAKVIQKINNRPRKCLGYRTPQEVLDEASDGALAI
ncbi:IS30 family transposase [Geopsychrobacter electrodiphilus]|uniref:IS30 family transposase n=1 Tax=Geopsychrobacter electrodiphilus TaxID=225196 RepID=UPI00037DDD0F|nr:IS30 family transposase [Geopsychrobacter electrodiphilus]